MTRLNRGSSHPRRLSCRLCVETPGSGSRAVTPIVLFKSGHVVASPCTRGRTGQDARRLRVSSRPTGLSRGLQVRCRCPLLLVRAPHSTLLLHNSPRRQPLVTGLSARYWSCCKVQKTTEFSEFMSFPGCKLCPCPARTGAVRLGVCLLCRVLHEQHITLCRHEGLVHVHRRCERKGGQG